MGEREGKGKVTAGLLGLDNGEEGLEVHQRVDLADLGPRRNLRGERGEWPRRAWLRVGFDDASAGGRAAAAASAASAAAALPPCRSERVLAAISPAHLA